MLGGSSVSLKDSPNKWLATLQGKLCGWKRKARKEEKITREKKKKRKGEQDGKQERISYRAHASLKVVLHFKDPTFFYSLKHKERTLKKRNPMISKAKPQAPYQYLLGPPTNHIIIAYQKSFKSRKERPKPMSKKKSRWFQKHFIMLKSLVNPDRLCRQPQYKHY